MTATYQDDDVRPAVSGVWLIIFLALTGTAALMGAQSLSDEWYLDLAKPSWTPPVGWFIPVWGVLYPLIAIAGWLVWTRRKLAVANLFWFAQIIANGAWSVLFFGRHDISSALLCVIALLVLIAGFVAYARRVHRGAALLFVPYFAWVALAAVLNGFIWYMNEMPMGPFDPSAFPA